MKLVAATDEDNLRRSAVRRRIIRQVALFIGMLISGGLLLFPRLPLIGLLLLICILYKNPARLLKREFAMIWLLLALVAAMALLAGGSFQIEFMATRYANFLGGIALLLLYVDARPDTFARDLVPVFRVMAALAILTPVAVLMPGITFQPLPIGDTEYQTFFLLFTYHDMVANAGWFKRPDGFFFEPGVLQLYLNIYVAISLFVLRLGWRDLALGVASVVITLSTTGAVILAFQLTVAYFSRVNVRNGPHRQLLALLLAPLLLLPSAFYAISNVNDKLTGEGRGSAWARQYDLLTGLAVVAESPITGIGFDYDRYYALASRVGYRETRLSEQNISERSNSNGIATLLYSVGVPLSLMFLFGLLKQKFVRPRVVMAVILLLSLSTEALIFTPFVLMIIFSGLLIAPAHRVMKRATEGRPRLARV